MIVGAGWFLVGQVQQRRQFGQERRVVRALMPVGVLSARDDGIDVIGGLVHAFPSQHGNAGEGARAATCSG